MSDEVRNNTAENRELDIDGRTALAFYRMEPGVITFVHTEVPQELSGRGGGRVWCTAPWSRSARWG